MFCLIKNIDEAFLYCLYTCSCLQYTCNWNTAYRALNNQSYIYIDCISSVFMLSAAKKRNSTSSDADILSPSKMYERRRSDKDKRSGDASGRFCKISKGWHLQRKVQIIIVFQIIIFQKTFWMKPLLKVMTLSPELNEMILIIEWRNITLVGTQKGSQLHWQCHESWEFFLCQNTECIVHKIKPCLPFVKM